MSVERVLTGTSLVDVLDRILDKGIVIDAWARVSIVGIDLITVEARVVVASVDTYLRYSDALAARALAAPPAVQVHRLRGASDDQLAAENANLRALLAEVKRGPAARARARRVRQAAATGETR